MSAASSSGRAARVIAIGGSAGAVHALLALLPMLPAGFAFPLLIVVHVPPDRRNMLVPLFQGQCRLPVREADDKEPITPGVVYFAPSNYHLLMEDDETLALSVDEPVHYSRPSIDVLLESAADAAGERLVAIILTGANDDGAAGLRAAAAAGGLAIVQDPAEAEFAAMPAAALAACPQAASLGLARILDFLLRLSVQR